MVKAKVFIFEKQFEGFPKEGDLKLTEVDLGPVRNGEYLVEAVYLSVDPYMRVFAPHLKTGTPFIGTQVAKIIESKNPKFPVGKYVVGDFGWRSHTIVDESFSSFVGSPAPFIIPDPGKLSLSLFLGVLGMPGNTAYFGFLEICQPKAGETVLVTGAAGAVGSLVGQIAKLKGCKVIGITGSDEKGKWLTEELNFDGFINYKTANLDKSLKEMVPEGIDCFFDNVGGEQASVILKHMNKFGRKAVCGAIAAYNETTPLKVTDVQHTIVSKQLKIQGLVVTYWIDRWLEGINQMKQWVQEGKIKYRETTTEGFENMFSAFTGMLKGDNIGKAVVKA